MSDLLNGRMTTLLADAAQGLAEHRSPFSWEWLNAHEVTLEESVQLADLISIILAEAAPGAAETPPRVGGGDE